MKEIVLENEKLRVSILPELGGKVRSIFFKSIDFEVTAQPGAGKVYRKAIPDGIFGDYDMSGIDDAFPNIDAETIRYDSRLLSYPDHGEIWSREMEVGYADNETVRLYLHSENFGYDYEKTIKVSDNAVKFSYEIKNNGGVVFPCIWTMHGLMRYEKDMIFHYPMGVRRFVNVLSDTPLGDIGREFEYPGDGMDFEHLPIKGASEKPYYAKYYCPDKIGIGECGISYPSYGVRVDFAYDAMALPWLGVWINGGGYSDDYNVAMEMTNGYYDSINRALANEKVLLLQPKEILQFSVELSLSKI